MTLALPNQVLADDKDAREAQRVSRELGQPGSTLQVTQPSDAQAIEVPRELVAMLEGVLQAIASGQTITITRMPEKLTTTAAAHVLGVSRPTLMKMIDAGRIPAHKVGTHTRLLSKDVLAERDARMERERAASMRLLDSAH